MTPSDSLRGGDTIEPGTPRVLLFSHTLPADSLVGRGARTYDVAADGQRFLVTVRNREADRAPIVVTLGWQNLLGQPAR